MPATVPYRKKSYHSTVAPIKLAVTTRFRSRSDTAPLAMVFLPVDCSSASSKIMSAAFSAIIIAGTLVLPETSVGMMEQSTTHSPSAPRTRRRGSTTAPSSLPMRHVPEGWKMVAPLRRAKSRMSASLSTAGPGRDLLRDQIGQGRRVRELARELDALDRVVAVRLGREIIGVDARTLQRIARGEFDRAAAFRPQLADRQREAGKVVHLAAGHVGAQRRDMELDVGRSWPPASAARTGRPG